MYQMFSLDSGETCSVSVVGAQEKYSFTQKVLEETIRFMSISLHKVSNRGGSVRKICSQDKNGIMFGNQSGIMPFAFVGNATRINFSTQ